MNTFNVTGGVKSPNLGLFFDKFKSSYIEN